MKFSETLLYRGMIGWWLMVSVRHVTEWEWLFVVSQSVKRSAKSVTRSKAADETMLIDRGQHVQGDKEENCNHFPFLNIFKRDSVQLRHKNVTIWCSVSYYSFKLIHHTNLLDWNELLMNLFIYLYKDAFPIRNVVRWGVRVRVGTSWTAVLITVR